MQKLSVREFKEYCAKLSPHKYVFSTENQEGDKVESTIRGEAEFNSMIISFNPNTIRLKSGRNHIKFERVKYIKVEEKSMIGDVFTIVCGGFSAETNDNLYTVVAQ